jgi:hemoglobin-like flavoprotein
MANDDLSWGAPDAPPLDPGVLSVIRASAAWLAEREDSFVQQLHAGIVALMPEMAAGGRALCERLVRSLLWTATARQSPQVAGDTLRWVGARNRLEGFDEAHYADVARALVLAVRNVSGDAWDNSMGSAWISYFRWAQPYLRAGAEQAAAEQVMAEQAAAQQAATRLEAARQAAAEAQAQAQAQALEHHAHGGEPVAADAGLEAVAGLLDEEDEDDDAGYGQIMLSMTRNPRRHRLPD